ncbi:hypothetical protein GCM10027418_04650 [Mariniluteicoccus endophyticus]
MTPGEIVEAFVQLTAQCLDALVVRFEGTERPTIWTGVLLQPRDGSHLVRSGALDCLGTFRLHGRGCRFELESGADVDVDWDAEGRAVFDSWRVLMYARSIGEASVDQESLRQAALDAVAVVAIGPDTFTWPHRRYDLTVGGV